MSCWALIKGEINDLEVFKKTCDRAGIYYRECNEARSFQGYTIKADLCEGDVCRGHLVHDGGGFRVVMDTDGNYNPLAKRLGGDGGHLIRNYEVDAIEKQLQQSGCSIVDRTYEADGSIVLRAVGGV